MASEHQTGGHRSVSDVEVGLTGARFGGAAGRRRRAEPGEDAGATRRRRDDQASAGESGAQLPPVLKRWRRKKEDPEHPGSAPPTLDDPAPGDPAPGDPAKTTGVVPAPHRGQPVPHPGAFLPQPEPSRVDGAEWVEWPEWEIDLNSDGLVRPYFWTGGRTAPRFDLSFETLISATGQPVGQIAPPEHHTILTLCDAPRSVAEIAALLSMPLGVARVVLGDMAEAGSVAVHRTVGSADAAPDLDLMQRVLNGLQRL